jgi:hypothetical protein
MRILKDLSEIELRDTGLSVRFSHWSKRRDAFDVEFDEMLSLTAKQVEPATMEIHITVPAGTYVISEEMKNWSGAVDSIRRHFPLFDWDKFEKVRGTINESFVCWSGL